MATVTTASLQVAVVDMASRPIGTTNLMIPYPLEPNTPPAEFHSAELQVAGGSTPEYPFILAPSKGTYLSIRREGNRFVGGILLTGMVDLYTSQFPGELGGAFDVPAPK
jgi:hypothetical protein